MAGRITKAKRPPQEYIDMMVIKAEEVKRNQQEVLGVSTGDLISYYHEDKTAAKKRVDQSNY